jgi:hypothetical protein
MFQREMIAEAGCQNLLDSVWLCSQGVPMIPAEAIAIKGFKPKKDDYILFNMVDKCAVF